MNKTVFLYKLKMSTITTFRYFLALAFFIYGGAKIYPGQFSTGEFVFDSPKDSAMQLAWHFFGYSDIYNLFIAGGEITAALLLLIPRTATLGNIIYLPITVNITILDYCFNIPALAISSLLTFMSISLLLFEYRKLKMIFCDCLPLVKKEMSHRKKVNIL